MKENERILNETEKRNKEMKEKEEERKQNEIEKENEKEKEFDQKKRVEKEIKVKETSVSKEKDSSGKDVSEQEQVSSVSTNTHVTFSRVVTFLVSEELVNKFQLHDLPKERRFTLVGKGDPTPPLPQGKEGKCYKAFQSPSTYLSVCDYIDDMFNCHSLINGDVFVSNDGKDSITNGNCGVDEYVGEIRLIDVFELLQSKLHVVEKVASDIAFKRPPYSTLVNCYSQIVDFVVNGARLEEKSLAQARSLLSYPKAILPKLELSSLRKPSRL
ncbi:hypothetical protein PVK06_011779 [Gossypium arboreum]|uniref:Uncharacterized protein n=1 Tax=Gossypium arboreum TaxID=29729 RepID=A0ABR0QA13_GOSAR|nr:hypothetical protein PVK06_011779 [Gossypium arboreum]